MAKRVSKERSLTAAAIGMGIGALALCVALLPDRAPPKPVIDNNNVAEIATRPSRLPAELNAVGERELMVQLRDALDADPALALRLAQEGERRFPTSDAADERSFLKILALHSLHRARDVRREAEAFFKKHPLSRFGRQVSLLTGSEPL